MDASSDLFIVGIHGMPIEIEIGNELTVERDPHKQLETIQGEIVTTFPNLGTSYKPYRWYKTPKEAVRAVGDIKRGKLAINKALLFAEWLKSELPEDKRLVIIAYSAGGIILYHWLAYIVHDTRHLAAAFAIAAPHDIFNRTLTFGMGPKAHEIRSLEPQIPCDRILEKLMAGKLVVFLAELDTLIRRKYAEFPQEDVAAGKVNQHIILGATHISICENKIVRELIIEKIGQL